MQRALAILLVVSLLASCETGGPSWERLPATADPQPSGTSDLREYKESYYRSLGTTFSGTLSLAELVAECASTRIVWLGDLHDDRELHARQRHLLEELCARGTRLALLLEAIGIEDEPVVTSYLADQIGRTTLRRLIHDRWPKSWLDDPDLDGAHYQAMLDFAKQEHIPVHALEPVPRGPLSERDVTMARRIRELAARYPDRTLVVHVGSAHLLGQGDLVGKVGARGVVIGAKLSAPLEVELQGVAQARQECIRTANGVVFLLRVPGR